MARINQEIPDWIHAKIAAKADEIGVPIRDVIAKTLEDEFKDVDVSEEYLERYDVEQDYIPAEYQDTVIESDD